MMKKFEEEVKGKAATMATQPGCSMTRKVWYKADDIHELSEGWVSPEDHQAEIEKTELQNLKYREEIARMQKALRKKNKAITELNGAVKKVKSRLKECEDLRIEANNQAATEYSLKCEVVEERAKLTEEVYRLKSQLEKQQPEIPEVPQFVAVWYEKNKGSLDYMIFETCRNLMDESTDEFENWFGYDENKAITTLVNMKNGYTVAKEKRFYLKNKLTEQYLYHAECNTLDELPDFDEDSQFTQQEIDSMETGSYEQIEVEE